MGWVGGVGTRRTRRQEERVKGGGGGGGRVKEIAGGDDTGAVGGVLGGFSHPACHCAQEREEYATSSAGRVVCGMRERGL
eukprot:746716-Hanusia_phi.AAC.2